MVCQLLLDYLMPKLVFENGEGVARNYAENCKLVEERIILK